MFLAEEQDSFCVCVVVLGVGCVYVHVMWSFVFGKFAVTVRLLFFYLHETSHSQCSSDTGMVKMNVLFSQ